MAYSRCVYELLVVFGVSAFLGACLLEARGGIRRRRRSPVVQTPTSHSPCPVVLPSHVSHQQKPGLWRRIAQLFRCCRPCRAHRPGPSRAQIGHQYDEACPICLEELSNEVATTKCNHRFHTGCLLTWRCDPSHRCPCCRADLEIGAPEERRPDDPSWLAYE